MIQLAAAFHGERSNLAPSDPDKFLLTILRNTVLRESNLEQQWLPLVWINHAGAGLFGLQDRIDRFETGRVFVPVRLVRAVFSGCIEDRLPDPIAYRGGRVTLRVRVVRIELCALQCHIETLERDRARTDRVPCFQNPMRGEHDGFGSSGFRGDDDFLLEEHALRTSIRAGPSVVHRGGQVKQISGVHGRLRQILADRVQDQLVPNPSPRVRAVPRNRRPLFVAQVAGDDGFWHRAGA